MRASAHKLRWNRSRAAYRLLQAMRRDNFLRTYDRFGEALGALREYERLEGVADMYRRSRK